jgi:SAM-dependent methyltransferase
MRHEHHPYLQCPITGESFELVAFDQQRDHVVAGILRSKSSWYPIVNGVPRLMIGELKTNVLQIHHDFLKRYRSKMPAQVISEWQQAIDEVPDFDKFLKHQKKTAESFAFEWKYIYKENNYEKQNFLHFLSPFVGERDLHNKITLDIGCGSGRFTKWAALSGTKVSFGSDLGETVEVAYELTKDLPNACIIQADIYAMPFDGAFDLAYSIGVLHHLPQPQEGFSRLPKVVRPDGELLIWVYNRRGNARAIYLYEPLRAIFKHVPKPLLFGLCYLPALVVHLFNLLTGLFKFLGLPKIAKKVPFEYYANFPFNMKLNDAFDVLATPKSNYYYKEQITTWFREAGLKRIRAHEHPEAGITCIGTRVG